MVLSTIRYSKSGSSDIASNIRCQTPFSLHRLKRRKTLFHSPKTSGKSRQGDPVRTIHSTPSTKMRLSRPELPRLRSSPMMCGAIRAQAISLNTSRSRTPKVTSLPRNYLESPFRPRRNPQESTQPSPAASAYDRIHLQRRNAHDLCQSHCQQWTLP